MYCRGFGNTQPFFLHKSRHDCIWTTHQERLLGLARRQTDLPTLSRCFRSHCYLPTYLAQISVILHELLISLVQNSQIGIFRLSVVSNWTLPLHHHPVTTARKRTVGKECDKMMQLWVDSRFSSNPIWPFAHMHTFLILFNPPLTPTRSSVQSPVPLCLFPSLLSCSRKKTAAVGNWRNCHKFQK